MISHTLDELADKARQIEDLLPGSSPTYRRMYLQLEHDIEIALTRIANSIVKKFNMEIPIEPEYTTATAGAINATDDMYGDSVAFSEDTNDPSD